jgi:hypothetical protein
MMELGVHQRHHRQLHQQPHDREPGQLRARALVAQPRQAEDRSQRHQARPREHAVADVLQVVLEGAAIAVAPLGTAHVVVVDELVPEGEAVPHQHRVVPGHGGDDEQEHAARQLELEPQIAPAAGDDQVEHQHHARQRHARRSLGQRCQRRHEIGDEEVELPPVGRPRAPPQTDAEEHEVRQHRHQANGAHAEVANDHQPFDLHREHDQLRQHDEREQRRE